MSVLTQQETERKRVLLVDQQVIVRQGLAQLINQEADLVVCGDDDHAPQVLKTVAAVKPDVIVMDVARHDGGGIDLLKDLHREYPSVPIVVLSGYDETIYAERVLRAGAQGYIMKNEDVASVMSAIRRAMRGEIALSEKMASEILHRLAGRRGGSMTPADISDLSDREMEIFQMLGKGMRVREIAEKLYLSVKTIEAHREHIKQKLNLKSSNELLRYAFHVMSGA